MSGHWTDMHFVAHFRMRRSQIMQIVNTLRPPIAGQNRDLRSVNQLKWWWLLPWCGGPREPDINQFLLHGQLEGPLLGQP
eukprot:358473-Chlamydomonas_euryale.AAC.5